MDNKTNPLLNQEWLNIQQQYIDALTSLKPEQATSGYTRGNQQAWKEALDHWWKSIGQQLPDGYKPMLDSVIRQTSTFYGMADQFAALLNDISASGNESSDWQALMSRHFGKMKAALDTYYSGKSGSEHAAAFIWPQPIEGWEQMAGSVSKLPDDLLDYLKNNKTPESNLFARLAVTPGVGPGREFQEKVGRAVSLWGEYQAYYRDYCAAFIELSKLALDRLEEKIIALANSGGKISSIKEIYNLWIDSSEEVFAEFAFNEEYSLLYGNLINSLMEFKQHNDSMIDDILPLLNMPTRKSMDTVYKRQQQLRHQLRDSRETQSQIETSLDQLRTELAKLRNKFDTDTQQPVVKRRKSAGKRSTKKPHTPDNKKTG